jgi:hypothetical protein
MLLIIPTKNEETDKYEKSLNLILKNIPAAEAETNATRVLL